MRERGIWGFSDACATGLVAYDVVSAVPGENVSARYVLLLLFVHGHSGVGRCRRSYRASTHRDLRARPKPPSAAKGRLLLLAPKAMSIATLIIAVLSCAWSTSASFFYFRRGLCQINGVKCSK